MINLVYRSLVSIALIVGMTADAQQQPKQSHVEYVQAKVKRFVDYRMDFNTFSGNVKGESPIIVNELRSVARSAAERLVGVEILLAIYESLISCEADRGKVWQAVKGDLDYCIDRFDEDIEIVNASLSFTKSPAIRNVRYSDERRSARGKSIP